MGPVSASRRFAVFGMVWGLLALGACQTAPPYAAFDIVPPPVVVADASPERAALNAEVYDAATSLVERLYYDPTMAGLDWAALTARYRPQALIQPTELDLYRVMDTLFEQLDDRHTNVTSPSARALKAAQERDEATVAFGMTVMREGDDYVIARVRPDGPAGEAGVQVGWRVVSVNGLAPGFDLVPSETRTDVLVLTDEDGRERTVSLTGRRLEARPRREALRRDDGVLVLRFDGFTLADRTWMSEQLEEIAADPPRGVVLDLRGNAGGRLNVLGSMVAAVFPEPVAYAVTLGRFLDRRYQTTVNPRAWTGPLAVMIGPGSGSASELLAATVQERGRGPVVGRRSAGAVIGSRGLNLPDGGELNVSTLAILTARRTLLEKVGVMPDVPTEPSLADLRAGRDPTLDAAIAALNPP